MQTKIEVDNEVMELTNNVLRATADGKKPTEYLSDLHKKWWESAEDCQKSVRIYINDQYPIDPAEFGCIGHPHNGFTSFFSSFANFFSTRTLITQNQLDTLSKQGYFAPEKGKDENRKYSKYRVIVSDVPMINQDGSVTIMKVVTTCAPNLMGTNQADHSEFIDSNGNVKPDAYKNACDQIAHLVAIAAKENNINPLKISEFGLGVYLNSLSDEQKNVARSIMYKAFAEAAQKNEVNINWLIWSKITNAKSLVKNLNTNHFNGYNYISAEPGDLIADVNQWKSQNPNVGELNNGSDRTIGGFITHKKPTTTEEQLAQASLLVFIQAKSNPHYLDQVKYVNLANPTQTSSPIQKTTVTNDNSLQLSTANQLDLSGILEVNRQDGNYNAFKSASDELELNPKVSFFSSSLDRSFIIGITIGALVALILLIVIFTTGFASAFAMALGPLGALIVPFILGIAILIPVAFGALASGIHVLLHPSQPEEQTNHNAYDKNYGDSTYTMFKKGVSPNVNGDSINQSTNDEKIIVKSMTTEDEWEYDNDQNIQLSL